MGGFALDTNLRKRKSCQQRIFDHSTCPRLCWDFTRIDARLPQRSPVGQIRLLCSLHREGHWGKRLVTSFSKVTQHETKLRLNSSGLTWRTTKPPWKVTGLFANQEINTQKTFIPFALNHTDDLEESGRDPALLHLVQCFFLSIKATLDSKSKVF